MNCKLGPLYELVTTGVIDSGGEVVYGINPNCWRCLPTEGVAILKIRQAVLAGGDTLPVAIAIPASSTITTVGNNTCCAVSNIAVVNPINVAVTGASMVNNTERLIYFNKVKGIIRLMDCCTPTAAA